MAAPERNKNAAGHENPRSGRKGHAIMHSLPYEDWQAFRDACELSEGRTLTNGEFDEMWREAARQGVRAFIEAPKPEPKWTVYLFYDGAYDGKLLREVKDLSEEDAIKFAVAHQNVEVDGKICNRIIAREQGRRNSERRWEANEAPTHLTF